MSRIVCAGGGTLGSVTPLLSLVPALRSHGHTVSWVGTYSGPERKLVEKAQVPFYPLVAPKFRRYVSFRHLLIPFEAAVSFVQSLVLVIRLRPQLVLSAGGFVAVPFAWVARMCGARVIVHQQDVEVGLANRLTFPVAHTVTTVLPSHDRSIEHRNVMWIGNPVRDLTPTTQQFHHHGQTILIFGGGTGAAGINALVSQSLCENATVIHITGEGKSAAPFEHLHYLHFTLLTEAMKEALQRADVVVCRAGLGTLSELASLKKAAIIIPLPGTHQEKNAELLSQHHAAVVIHQKGLTQETLSREVYRLLNNQAERTQLGTRLHALFPQDAVARYSALVDSVLRRE